MGDDRLNESSCLGWRDHPTPASRHSSLCCPFLDDVNLVADDNTAELLDTVVWYGGLVAEVVPPLRQRTERVGLVHVEHQDDRICAAEEGRREAREPLLPRRVLRSVRSRVRISVAAHKALA